MLLSLFHSPYILPCFLQNHCRRDKRDELTQNHLYLNNLSCTLMSRVYRCSHVDPLGKAPNPQNIQCVPLQLAFSKHLSLKSAYWIRVASQIQVILGERGGLR